MNSLVGRCLEGRYHIRRLLGQGQFAYVFLATDRVDGHDVAVKVPRDDHESRESLEAEHEFLLTCTERAASYRGGGHFLGVLLLRRILQLERAVMCHVFDVILCDMLRVHEQYRESGLPVDVACSVAKDVARGLHFLHASCGIIHMDVKLENIGVLDLSGNSGALWDDEIDHVPMFGQSVEDDAPSFGEARVNAAAPAESPQELSLGRLGSPTTRFVLFDFGNATWADPSRQTPVEQTVLYRSPEVVLQAGPRQPAADLWSLGCVLWELVCGRRFFDLTAEDLNDDGSRHQRLSQIARIQAVLREPLCDDMLKAYAIMGGHAPPAYPMLSAQQRTISFVQRLRESQQGSPAMRAFCGLVASLLTMSPGLRPSAADTLEMAEEIKNIPTRDQVISTRDVDELDMAIAGDALGF